MGNCLFLRAQGWGIDRQVRKKWQIPGGMPGGGMVTGRIEPCIIVSLPESVVETLKVVLTTGLPSSVCVVGCAFVMAVLVYQISKTKTEI